MFNPSLHQARAFFIDSWRKFKESKSLTPLETMSVIWIKEHPEYHKTLEDKNSINQDYIFQGIDHNPFLHLSLHLAIAEQVNIDQPFGIKLAYKNLSNKTNMHKAAHELIECLEIILYESQISKKRINNEKYMELIKTK